MAVSIVSVAGLSAAVRLAFAVRVEVAFKNGSRMRSLLAGSLVTLPNGMDASSSAAGADTATSMTGERSSASLRPC